MFLVFRATFIVIVVCYFNLIIKKENPSARRFSFFLQQQARPIIDDECKQKERRGERVRAREKGGKESEMEKQAKLSSQNI